MRTKKEVKKRHKELLDRIDKSLLGAYAFMLVREEILFCEKLHPELKEIRIK